MLRGEAAALYSGMVFNSYKRFLKKIITLQIVHLSTHKGALSMVWPKINYRKKSLKIQFIQPVPCCIHQVTGVLDIVCHQFKKLSGSRHLFFSLFLPSLYSSSLYCRRHKVNLDEVKLTKFTKKRDSRVPFTCISIQIRNSIGSVSFAVNFNIINHIANRSSRI